MMSSALTSRRLLSRRLQNDVVAPRDRRFGTTTQQRRTQMSRKASVAVAGAALVLSALAPHVTLAGHLVGDWHSRGFKPVCSPCQVFRKPPPIQNLLGIQLRNSQFNQFQ